MELTVFFSFFYLDYFCVYLIFLNLYLIFMTLTIINVFVYLICHSWAYSQVLLHSSVNVIVKTFGPENVWSGKWPVTDLWDKTWKYEKSTSFEILKFKSDQINISNFIRFHSQNFKMKYWILIHRKYVKTPKYKRK